MTKPVSSHVLALMMIFVINVFRRQGCPHLGQGHGPIVSSRQNECRVPSQTIPDCKRYIIGVFCYNFKSQTNILASY